MKVLGIAILSVLSCAAQAAVETKVPVKPGYEKIDLGTVPAELKSGYGGGIEFAASMQCEDRAGRKVDMKDAGFDSCLTEKNTRGTLPNQDR